MGMMKLWGIADNSFAPTAECYGVFAQYRFRCVLGELGRFREGTGFRERVPGFDGLREVPGFQEWLQVPMAGVRKVAAVSKVLEFRVYDGS